MCNITHRNVAKGIERRSARAIDATVEFGFELHLQIMRQRLTEGIKIRWLMQESFFDKVTSMLRSATKLPEIRATPRLFGHVYQTEKEAAFCLRQNDGTHGLFHFLRLPSTVAQMGKPPLCPRVADSEALAPIILAC